MAVELQAGTPLAESLQNVLQPKLVEMGWSTGGLDDSALAEYIVLMLINGKTQEQIAAELSNDLLGLEPEDAGAISFAQWMFEQLHILRQPHAKAQVQGQETVPEIQPLLAQAAPPTTASPTPQSENADTQMDDVGAVGQGSAIPTGPKSMRDGPRPIGNKRMLGQVNRALTRTPEATILHKIKGTANSGRINTHTREPPKGPTPKGPRQQVNQMNRAIPPQQPRSIPHTTMNPMMPGNPFGTLSPQQQMQLLGLYEEQARMMAQILSPAQQQMGLSQFGTMQQNFPPHAQAPGKSLFERVDAPNGKGPPSLHKRPHQNRAHSDRAFVSNQFSAMENADSNSSMEVEPSSQTAIKTDPASTMCYFNTGCTKPDCPFVHQSAAAPPGTTIDMTDVCSFGASCKNRKCVGKHPSPAKAGAQRSQEDCKFYPNCTNANCPFRHPTTPPCRNGADCTVEGCRFAHSKIACKFDPCLNPACPYKHHDGQKRGTYQDKVWVGADNGDDGKEHVSERKFVADTAGAEDLVLPGNNLMDEAAIIS